MKITPESTTYRFELVCGDVKLAFNMAGKDQEEAKQKLIQALQLALGQLEGTITVEKP